MAWFSKVKKRIIERRNAAESLAVQMGMQFRKKEQFSSVPLLKGFRLFQTQYKKGISNIMSMTDEMEEAEYKIFDYKYVIQAGNTPVTLQQTVFFINSKSFNFPKFTVYPRSKLSKWFHEIGFSSGKNNSYNKDFNKNYYYYKTDLDDSRLSKVFHAEFIDILNKSDGLVVEANNYHIIFYYHKKLLSTADTKKLYDTALKLINSIGSI